MGEREPSFFLCNGECRVVAPAAAGGDVVVAARVWGACVFALYALALVAAVAA